MLSSAIVVNMFVFNNLQFNINALVSTSTGHLIAARHRVKVLSGAFDVLEGILSCLRCNCRVKCCNYRVSRDSVMKNGT